VRAGESVCPVHQQAVYRLTIAPHTDGQVNSMTKVSLGLTLPAAEQRIACNV
jgi:hypothetical protein